MLVEPTVALRNTELRTSSSTTNLLIVHYLDCIKKNFCAVFECSIQGPSVHN